MSDKDDVGLFLAFHPELGRDVPCRITEATVITAQGPSERQVLSYRVGYWEKAPELSDEPKEFVGPGDAGVLFAMDIARPVELDAEIITQFCINHFLMVVLNGLPVHSVERRVKGLLSINRSPWTFQAPDRSSTVVVYDVQHHEHFKTSGGERMRRIYGVLSYSPLLSKVAGESWGVVDWNKIPRQSLTYTYTNQTRMVDDAAKHLMSKDVLTAVLTAAKEQSGAS